MSTDAARGRRAKIRRKVERPIGGFDPRPATVLATFFGVGFFPLAPATVASAVVAALMILIGTPPLAARLALFALVAIAGTWAAGRTEARYGEDARCIVIDEVAGMLAATLFVPWDPLHAAGAFVLFRALDILKPPPAYQFETLRHGVGVMADDIVAGFYALLLLLLAGLLLPSV
jgi:phosphatidylglycerophosphatase A